MAAKPEDLLNGVAGDANYPGGSGKDETTPGVSDDGTPLKAVIYNDIQGFLQSLLSDESITASGLADTILVSQYKQALGQFVARSGLEVDIAAAATCVLGKINRPLNAGGPITVDLPTTGLYAGAIVLFSPEPPAAYSVNTVTFDADTETIGPTESTAELTTDNLLGGFQRNRDNTEWVGVKLRTIGLGA